MGHFGNLFKDINRRRYGPVGQLLDTARRTWSTIRRWSNALDDFSDRSVLHMIFVFVVVGTVMCGVYLTRLLVAVGYHPF